MKSVLVQLDSDHYCFSYLENMFLFFHSIHTMKGSKIICRRKAVLVTNLEEYITIFNLSPDILGVKFVGRS